MEDLLAALKIVFGAAVAFGFGIISTRITTAYTQGRKRAESQVEIVRALRDEIKRNAQRLRKYGTDALDGVGLAPPFHISNVEVWVPKPKIISTKTFDRYGEEISFMFEPLTNLIRDFYHIQRQLIDRGETTIDSGEVIVSNEDDTKVRVPLYYAFQLGTDLIRFAQFGFEVIGNLNWQESECVAPRRYARQRQKLSRLPDGSYVLPIDNIWLDPSLEAVYGKARAIYEAANKAD